MMHTLVSEGSARKMFCTLAPPDLTYPLPNLLSYSLFIFIFRFWFKLVFHLCRSDKAGRTLLYVKYLALLFFFLVLSGGFGCWCCFFLFLNNNLRQNKLCVFWDSKQLWHIFSFYSILFLFRILHQCTHPNTLRWRGWKSDIYILQTDSCWS